MFTQSNKNKKPKLPTKPPPPIPSQTPSNHHHSTHSHTSNSVQKKLKSKPPTKPPPPIPSQTTPSNHHHSTHSHTSNSVQKKLKLDNQVFSNLLIFRGRIIEKINELHSFYVKIDGINQKLDYRVKPKLPTKPPPPIPSQTPSNHHHSTHSRAQKKLKPETCDAYSADFHSYAPHTTDTSQQYKVFDNLKNKIDAYFDDNEETLLTDINEMIKKIPEQKERAKIQHHLNTRQKAKKNIMRGHKHKFTGNDSSFFTSDNSCKLKRIMRIAVKRYGNGGIWPSNESKILIAAILDPNANISNLKEMVKNRAKSKKNPNSRLLDCIRKEVDKNEDVDSFEDIFDIKYQSACIGQGVYLQRKCLMEFCLT